MNNQAAQTMPELPVPWQCETAMCPDLYTADQMHQYARDYAAMLAAAPAASGGEDGPQHFDGHDHEGFPGGCERFGHSPKNCPAAASVSERARELLAAEYRTHGWHEDAGRLCMGGDPTSFVEDDTLRVITRLIEQGDEDTHVITELGRLLAGIAVILKGPEPAGTAWSYHDLPELVASALSEPRQVAAEMKAWAHTKMAEQQSSRRDRMMVAEWAKRLLPESSFPVKDFDVEGMSITKEAAREAVKQVALEQSLTQQRGEAAAHASGVSGSITDSLVSSVEAAMLACYMDHDDYRLTTTLLHDMAIAAVNVVAAAPQPSADAVRELVQRAYEVVHHYDECPAIGGCGDKDCRCDAVPFLRELESLLSAASGEGVG